MNLNAPVVHEPESQQVTTEVYPVTTPVTTVDESAEQIMQLMFSEFNDTEKNRAAM